MDLATLLLLFAPPLFFRSRLLSRSPVKRVHSLHFLLTTSPFPQYSGHIGKLCWVGVSLPTAYWIPDICNIGAGHVHEHLLDGLRRWCTQVEHLVQFTMSALSWLTHHSLDEQGLLLLPRQLGCQMLWWTHVMGGCCGWYCTSSACDQGEDCVLLLL